TSKKLISWVFPGVADTRATCVRVRPSSRLMRLDLPTFDRPENAICGREPGGGAPGFAIAPTKSTDLMTTVVLRPGWAARLTSRLLHLRFGVEHQQRRDPLGHAFGRDDDLPHIVARGDLEHHVTHQIFEHRAQAARSRASLDRLLGDGPNGLGV